MASLTAFVPPSPLGLRAHNPVPLTLRSPPITPRNHRRATECRAGPASSGRDPVVHYFAYFSNMNPVNLGPQAKVLGRRCNVVETRTATLRGFRLVFNVPGFPPEPVFANIEKISGSEVKGVLYSLRTSDFRRIVRSEGYISPTSDIPFPFKQLRNFAPAPRMLDVEVELDGGRRVNCTTLQWTRNLIPKPLLGIVKPSRRYVQAAVDGARYRGIDTPYVRNVLSRVQFERGPLGAFGLITTPKPHPLDDSRDVSSEFYSPFAVLDVGDEALRAFKTDDNINGDNLRLVQLTSSADEHSCELLYFVPGIDGTGRSVLPHVRRLESAGFQVCSVVYPRGNRESLAEISASLTELIAAHARGRRVNIIAESMGVMFALLCAVQEGRRRRKVVNSNGVTSMNGIDFGFMLLINSATSFSRTPLAPLWMSIVSARIPDDVYRAILAPLLLSVSVDISALQHEFSLAKVMHARNSLFTLDRFPDLLPRDVLRHRINLLESFTLTSTDVSYLLDVVGRKIGMVCAENDRLLPSFQEGLRFQKQIPGLKLAVVPYGGHTILQDSRFNLAEYVRALLPVVAKKVPNSLTATSSAKRDERLDRRREAIRKRLRKVSGFENVERLAHALSPADVSRFSDFIAEYTALFSPVFVGEERLPSSSSNRPVILVSNHTLLPLFDGIFIVERLLRQYGILVKSMASRLVFHSETLFTPGMKTVSFADACRFGMTNLNPRSFGAALAAGEWTLLFPGGAREAFKRKSDAPYSLHWSPTTEFVRFAALFGAVVVPVSTVGTEDMVRVFADGPELQPTVEFLLQRVTNKNIAESVDVVAGGGAKAWKGPGNVEDISSLVPPIGVPTGLDRLYFRFGEPVEVPIEAFDDPNVAADVYAAVKSGIEHGVKVLLERRECDAYRSPAARARFAVANGVSPAPAGPAWAWGDGHGGVLGEDLQPRIE